MADFGQKGKLTIRADVNAVLVHDGEKIRYTVRVWGAEAIFVFACEHKSRKTARDFPGHPKQEYQWEWNNPTDRDADDDTYNVEMSFFTATKYSLRAEHVTSEGALINVLKDLDAESDEPSDKYPSAIEVIRA